MRIFSTVPVLMFLLLMIIFSVNILATGEVHDLRVSFEAGLAHLTSGNYRILNATVYNDGDVTENVTLQLLVNGTVAVSSNVTELPPKGFYTSSYCWKPSVDGVFNLTAYALPVVGEENIINNNETKWVNVCGDLPPVPMFTVSPEKPVANETVTFDASDSFDPDWGNIISYEWSLGDETIRTGKKATHTYKGWGNYTVTLTVWDTENLNSSESQNITVHARPKAYFKITNPPWPGPYHVNETITFDAIKSNDHDGYIANYTWDFVGGGLGVNVTTTNSTIMHNYTSPGAYLPTLVVTDNDGLTSSSYIETIFVALNIHDVAVIDVTLLRNCLHRGQCLGKPELKVTVENQGTYTETFNVTVYGTNTTVVTVGTQQVTLNPGENTILQFDWDTTSIPPGIYTISASVDIVPGELPADQMDNTLVDGTIEVRFLGDTGAEHNKTDGSDYVITVEATPSYPGHPKWCPCCDVNCDGVVDGSDVVMIVEHIPSYYVP